MDDFFNNILPGFLRSDTSEFGGGAEHPNADVVVNIVQVGLTLLFAVVLLAAVVFAVNAGLKYITSSGEADKVEEAKESLKNVFIGLIASFVSIIVIVIIQGVFTTDSGASNLVVDTLRCYLDEHEPSCNRLDGTSSSSATEV